MSKRKRDEIDDDRISQIEDRAIRIKASRLKAKIDQGNQILTAALKLARGFERQKMSRRQKQASSEPHTLLRLREEVIILKELDLGKTAKRYLFKQMAKTKRVSESAVFTTMYGINPKTEGPQSSAEANVIGRLFKSNPIKEALPDILKGINAVLGLEKNARDPTIVPKTSSQDPSSVVESRSRPDDQHTILTLSETTAVDDLDEVMIDSYSNRLAASSDDESDSGSFDSKDQNGDPIPLPSSQSDSDAVSNHGKSSKKTKINAVKAPSSTAFLPSLNMAGYYSGSESGEDENFYGDATPVQQQQRKNRRGQRARQQIAEKKYGQNAKHLQNQKQNVNTNTSWDARKGAIDVKPRKPSRFGRDKVSRTTKASGANVEAVGVSKPRFASTPIVPKSEGSLHPSWEAARKKKLENNKHMTAFVGKKITFD